MQLITNLLYDLKLPYCGARYHKVFPGQLVYHHPYIPSHIAIWTALDSTASCEADEDLLLEIGATCD